MASDKPSTALRSPEEPDGVLLPPAPTGKVTLRKRLEVTLILSGVGAIGGFVVGTVLLATLQIGGPDPYDWFTNIPFAAAVGGGFGAVLGALAGPIAAWGFLRRVPIGVLLGWSMASTAAGAVIGFGLTQSPVTGGCIGFLVGALLLKVWSHLGWALPGWKSFVASSLLIAIGGWRAYKTDERRVAADLLEIRTLPPYVEVIGCNNESSLRSAHATCTIAIRPSDLPLLLAGHPYTRNEASGTTGHWVTQGAAGWATAPGGPFPVAAEYRYEQEKRGLLVRILVNQEITRAVVDLVE
jgi:hypothetical protein